MYCRNCGKELNQGDTFCKECGAAVEGNEKLNSPTEKRTDNQKKKKKGKKILIALIIIIVIFIMAVALSDDKTSTDNNKEKVSDVVDNIVDNNSLTFDEKVMLAIKNNDFETINTLIADVTEENKNTFTTSVNDAAMKYLCNNRYKIFMHNYNFIEETYNKLKFAENDIFKDYAVLNTYSLLKNVYNCKSIVDEYDNATDLIYGVAEVDGEIVNRVQNADYVEIANQGLNEEYLDEYTVRVEWPDNDYIVLRSTEPLTKGYYYGYARYIETRTYTSSDGFEHERPVYSPLSTDEIAAYRAAENSYTDICNRYDTAVKAFDALEENIYNHSSEYCDKLNESNYTGNYIGGVRDESVGLGYDGYHKLTLNEDNTFKLIINAGYGFNTYEGSFTKEGNLIKCKYYDVTWTFEIKATELIHTGTTGEMDGMLFANQIFIK